MSTTVDYKSFIEYFFYIKTKEGQLQRFKFNEPQTLWYNQLQESYGPEMQGIRENDLKGRQFGISSVISAIFTTDFILSATGEIDLIDSDIYSHKEKETASHFARVNMYLDSYLLAVNNMDYINPEHRKMVPAIRKQLLKTDTTNLLIARNGTQIQTATAGAKVSGRGSTRQNLHWSEVAFYSDTPIISAKNLVTGAEEQVPDNFGKIFRETTGHMLGDFFSDEYYQGKDGRSDFHSRFLVWYLMKDYSREAPEDWVVPDYYTKLLEDNLATIDQCYWHYVKTRSLTDKIKIREYPTYDYEAFLMSGTTFFDSTAMLYHNNNVREPLKTAPFVQGLTAANKGREYARAS